ncbi:fimbrial protein [Providencia sp. PROV197]|uniref:fimbrial protein n=1 Tax=Providencia sp. PROV197 TaxID=2949898 RepID=UPI0023493603|nr:fimbrial protein [Providencia sp. PROV197]
MKIIPILVGITMGVSNFAFAAPQIIFQGEVSAQTCEPLVNGSTNSTVLLSTVRSSDLTTAGSTSGFRPFTISLMNCTAPTDSDLNINTVFLGHNVTANGNLGNAAPDNEATNVALQLLDSETGTNPIILNGPTSVPGLVLGKDSTTANYKFGVQYISENGNATPGKVTAVAEYTLSYL